MTALRRGRRPPRPDRLWRDRRFVTYWSGDTVSQIGDRVSDLALPIIAVTMLQVSPAAVGLLTAAIWAPNLLSVLVGSWVELRPSKRRLLVAANLVQAGAITSLPLAYLLAEVTFAQLLGVALVTGAAGVLAQTAYPSFFARLVRQDQFVSANSLLSGTRSASFVAGPVLAGTLIQVLTAPLALVVDAISFLAAAVAIRSVRVAESRPAEVAGREPLLRRAAAGLRFVFAHPYLRPALACVTTVNFFSFMVQAVLILYASRTLGLSPGQIGLALGLGAVGGLVGAILAAPLARRIGAGVTVAVGGVLFAAPFGLIPLAAGDTTTKLAVLAAVEFVSAIGVMLFDINLNAIQLSVTPDRIRSRVAGAFSTVNYGIRPLGAIVGGLLAQLLGVVPVVVVAAVGGTLAGLWLVGSPVVKVVRVGDLEPVDI